MKRFLLAMGALVIGAGAVSAQSNPIADRVALMRKAGRADAEVSKMIRGDNPFDLAKVQVSRQAMQDEGKGMPALFPDDSKTGETRAAPKVWENKADVTARFTKLAADSGDAAPKVVDEASMKAIYPALQQECDSCHEQYRLRRR